MPYATISSLASSTRSSAYFMVQITFPPIWKSPNPSTASLVRYLLYKLNRISDKQHPYLTPLPIFTLLVLPLFSCTSTLWPMYSSLINLLLHQLILVSFRICTSLNQFTWSNAFCHSMKQEHNSSPKSKISCDIILSIPVAFLVPCTLLNPNWSSPSTFSVFISNLLIVLAAVFAVCATRLIVQWSQNFVAFEFFFKAITVTSVKSLGHSPVSCMLLFSCVINWKPSSPKNMSITCPVYE